MQDSLSLYIYIYIYIERLATSGVPVWTISGNSSILAKKGIIYLRFQNKQFAGTLIKTGRSLCLVSLEKLTRKRIAVNEKAM